MSDNYEYEKDYDDEVYEDEYYEENFDEEELEDDDDVDDEDDDKDKKKLEDEDDEDYSKTKKIHMSFACDDCDYRWDDVIIRRQDEIEDDEMDLICPMCGSVNITQI